VNSKLSSLITASCGEISADMANETVVTAGMVATVRQLYTRNQRPFITALLEDLDGSTEVIVWPEVYNRTRELWQEGNILLVKGMVKLKEDRIQLSCYEAKPFQQSEVGEKEQSTEIRWHLTIGIKQTDDAEKDIECLRHVIDILQSYPGQNRVSLNVSSEGKTTKLELPKLTITYCPELASQLTSILGEDNVRLQQEFL
jgi:DNA polymerase-3 subunit alpha